METRSVPRTRGTEMPLPGLWHWLVMIPVAAFALLLTAGVLWAVIGTPLAARVSPPPVATARPAQLAVSDTATREYRLRQHTEAAAIRQLSWYPAIKDFKIEGETLTVSTSLPKGAASTYTATDIANRLLLDMRTYGDPVNTATVNDSGGQPLISLAYDAVIKPAGR